MLKIVRIVRVTLKNNSPPSIESVTFKKDPNKLHQLVIWELRGKGAQNGWFSDLTWGKPEPGSPLPDKVFGCFIPVDRSRWAVMANKHTGKETEGTWPYQLTLSLKTGRRRYKLTVPSVTGSNNPNIKNN